MAAWPESTNVIGSRVNRLDGLAKASGKAKYPSDMHPEGMLFAAVLYSPHAHAKITALDLTPADKMPGVKATHAIAKVGGLLRYQGDDIAAVAAETEEQALDALKAIKIEYELQPFVVTEEQAMAPDAPPVFKPNVR
jgi:xanthine dehydrogenase YagR molybdenum-binding subunit